MDDEAPNQAFTQSELPTSPGYASIANPAPEPLVSVVIAAHNEERFVERCLLSIKDCDWPTDRLEIIVVDHGSTDRTAVLASHAGARVIPQKGGMIGAVRNAGLKDARGDYVAYVDADCTVPKTWLRTAVALLASRATTGAVGGPCLSPEAGTWVERCLAASHSSPGLIEEAKTLATSSFITRSSLLREVGRFDEGLRSGEDDDISLRIRRHGFALFSLTDCHVIHHGFSRTLRSVVEKEKWHGSNQIEVRSELDITLLLTHLFLITSVILIPAMLLTAVRPTSLYVLIADILLQFAPPFLFAVKRLRQSPSDWHLILGLLVVGYAYFAGRSLGIIANYWRRLRT